MALPRSPADQQRLFEGITSLPRSRETSPRHPDALQRRFREPGHTATPVQPIGN
ncbi:hypothetical protein ACODT3_35510 [Streptomyces sp. 4.24]